MSLDMYATLAHMNTYYQPLFLNTAISISVYHLVTMFMKDGLDGKKMQGKSEGSMRSCSFRASKRTPSLWVFMVDYPFILFMASLKQT